MRYADLRDFILQLEARGELKRIKTLVDPNLEMTEIGDRVLRAGGPALLFEHPKGSDIPVLANLFGTVKRVALGMGEEDPARLREIGKLLAYLKEPEPPRGLRDAWDKWPVLKQVLNMTPSVVRSPACQEVVWEGKDVDLARLPIQTCWPGDVGPLLTWGLVITRGPHKPRQNLGIYLRAGPRDRGNTITCAGRNGAGLLLPAECLVAIRYSIVFAQVTCREGRSLGRRMGVTLYVLRFCKAVRRYVQTTTCPCHHLCVCPTKDRSACPICDRRCSCRLRFDAWALRCFTGIDKRPDPSVPGQGSEHPSPSPSNA